MSPRAIKRSGRDVVAELDRLEVDAEFWERYMDRLHADEARAIVEGDIGVIKRPVEPTWPVGEWLEVRSNFWIKPEAPKFSHRGYRIEFAIRDFRVRLTKRVPAMFDPPDLNDQGYPIPHTADAIKAATEDGNYTPAHALAVPQDVENVGREYDNVLQMNARDRWAEYQQTEHAEEHARKNARRVGAHVRQAAITLARNGVDPIPLLADLERRIAAELEQDREAA